MAYGIWGPSNGQHGALSARQLSSIQALAVGLSICCKKICKRLAKLIHSLNKENGKHKGADTLCV